MLVFGCYWYENINCIHGCLVFSFWTSKEIELFLTIKKATSNTCGVGILLSFSKLEKAQWKSPLADVNQTREQEEKQFKMMDFEPRWGLKSKANVEFL